MNYPRSLLFAVVLPVLAAALFTSPAAVRAGESDPAAGALTLESSSYARFFRAFGLNGGNTSGPLPFDRAPELDGPARSDASSRHASVHTADEAAADASARSCTTFAAEVGTVPRIASDDGRTVAWDFSAPVVAPVGGSWPAFHFGKRPVGEAPFPGVMASGGEPARALAPASREDALLPAADLAGPVWRWQDADRAAPFTATGPTPQLVAASAVYTNIADTTQTAPGRGNFLPLNNSSASYPPTLSGSNLAFLATSYDAGSSGSANSGIFTTAVNSPSLTTVAVAGQTVAPGRGTFTAFSTPALSGNTLAFFAASYDVGSSGTQHNGYYTTVIGGTGLTPVALTGQTAPGRGSFTAFNSSPPLLNSSTIAFLANSYDAGSSGTINNGLYTAAVNGTGLTTVAVVGRAAPGRGNFLSLVNPVLSGSTLAFSGNSYDAGSSGNYNNGLFTATVNGTGLTTVAAAGQTTAPSRGSFYDFGRFALSSGSLLFIATSYNTGSSGFTNDGLYTAAVNGTGLTTVAVVGQAAPGRGNFYNFNSLALSGNTLAFTASSYDAGSSGTLHLGLYTGTVGGTGLTTVALTGQTVAPGRGTFLNFGSTLTLSSGYLAFLANSYDAGSSGDTGSGLYLYRDGTFFNVAAKGDSLFGGTISAVSFNSTTAPGIDGDNLGFSYTLTSGVTGIGTFYTGVPEPATWLAGTLTLAAGSALRRRLRSVPHG